jgi:hypothetical protein
LNGGLAADFDEASYFDSTSPVIVNLSSLVHQGVAPGTVQDGTGGTDRLINIRDILGGQGDDTMYGGASNTIFEASGGNDSIVGGTSSTVPVFNVVDYFNSSDGVTVDLTKQGQAQTVSNSQGTDTFVNISDVYGSSFNDTIIGGNGDNIAFGREGTDRFALDGKFVTISHQDVVDKLFSIEEIDITGTGNNTLNLTALDVLQTSETGTMRIIGDTGDLVASAGQGWKFQGQQLIDGHAHDIYTTTVQGTQVTLEVDSHMFESIS